MKPVIRERGGFRGNWTIGPWHELHGRKSPPSFHDSDSAARWLRGFEPGDLRQIMMRFDPSAPLSRMTEPEVAAWLAGRIVSGSLVVYRTDSQDGHADIGADESAAGRLVRQLQVTTQPFAFEHDRLRIVTARQWSALRVQGDGGYRVVPLAAAQVALRKMAQWTALPTAERRVIEQLVPLVSGPSQAEGVLLLQRYTRSSGPQAAAAGPAFTPSQLAGRHKDEEVLYWVAIELVDADDQPVPHEPYKLKLPDGEMREGTLDAAGRAYVGDIKASGSCQVCFPEIDAKEWSAA